MKAARHGFGFAAAAMAGLLLLRTDFSPPAYAAAPGTESLSEVYRVTRMDDVAFQKIAPFKVFDNLYYVGPGYVSVWVIPTSEGLVLIDSAQEPYVDFVIDNIKKTGFDPKTVKYILLSHGHLDHFGGAARIQELSGARVVALDEDWKMIADVGSRPGRNGSAPPRVPARDMVVKDGDTLSIGGQNFTFYKHPGHTPGTLSIAFTVYDGGKAYKAFSWGGVGYRGGLEAAQQSLETADRVAKIEGVQVPILVHSWLGRPFPGGGVFERLPKLAARKTGEPNPFVDPEAWKTWVAIQHDLATLAVETEKAKAEK